MQAVVHRRCRDTEKVGDVLVRALVDVEQRCWLPQTHREFRNGGKGGSRVLALNQIIVRRNTLARDILSRCKRNDLQLPLSERPKCLMPDDATQPNRKSGVVGQAWQARPRGQKCLLDSVLGLMKIAQQSER